MTTFEELRAEYESDVLGPKLYGYTIDIVERALRPRPDEIYQPTGSEDVVHGFVEYTLLGQNQLDYFFKTATDLDHLTALFFRQVRRYLSATRQRTIADNLTDRSVRILRSDDRFEVIGEPPSRRFFLNGGGVHPFDSDRWKTAVSMALNGVPRIYTNPDERTPKVYTDENLAALLAIVLGELGGSASRSNLAKLFEELLTPWIATFLDESEPARQASEKLSGEDQMIVTETVKDMLSDLTDEAQLVFRLWHTGATDQVIADRLGVSRPTAINRRGAVADRLRPHLVDVPQPLRAATLQSLFLAMGGEHDS